ncbi:MAG TPA: hypothetical protein VLC94_01740 [Candidatus Acidoferrum sp.]|nr:hypothetical protein [Candidatus Acidoferrum sp.]
MKTICGTLLACLAAVCCLSPSAAGQDRNSGAWRDCQSRAASALRINMSDVDINPGGETERGRFILNWEARMDRGRRERGYCEIDRRDGRIVRFETNPYRGGDNGGGGYDPPQYSGDYPRVKVDTDGKGYFSSRGLRLDRLDRGFVDTRNEPSVTLRGRNGARITFFGRVIGFDGNREITLQITSSDRGDARGRASIRLNGDRNEVEAISLNGGMAGGGEFKGEFNRNR